jgi:hypothetical protein
MHHESPYRTTHSAITPALFLFVFTRSPAEVSGGQYIEESNNLLDIVEAELINVLAGRNNPKIVSQGVFLEKLFGEILQVSL